MIAPEGIRNVLAVAVVVLIPSLSNAQSVETAISSNQRIADEVSSFRIVAKGTALIAKGHSNEAIDRSHPLRRGTADLPAEDTVAPVYLDWTIDASNRRCLTSGVDIYVNPKESPDGIISVQVLAEPTRSAFDGRVVTALKPKEARDPNGISPNTRYPVEFYEFSHEGASIIFLPTSLPIFLSFGNLNDGRKPVDTNDLRPKSAEGTWRMKQLAQIDGKPAFVLVSTPTRIGSYVECGLDPELDYRPVYWSKYMKGQLVRQYKLRYADNQGKPILKSWSFFQYSLNGTLQRQDKMEVISIEINPPLDSDMFRLKPVDGMIIERATESSMTFEQAGNPSLKANSHYEVQYMIDARYFRRIAICVVMIITIVVALFFWRSRSAKKRKLT